MNTRQIWYQTRPSADRLGNAPHVYGRLQPMSLEQRGWLRRLIGGKPTDDEVPDHVALNPGTVRVENLQGEVLWPSVS
jgi:hypothetical protein